MDLPTAIRGLVTGSTAPPPSSPAALVAELRAAFGTRPPAGIPERTWRRARHQVGWSPTAPTRARLEAAARRLRLPPAREAQLRGKPAVAIQADITISNDERPGRTIVISGWPDPPDMGRLVGAYLRNDLQGAADYLERAMGRNVGGPLYVGDVQRLEMFGTAAEATRAQYEWRR